MGKGAAKAAQANTQAGIDRYAKLAQEQAASYKPMQDFANQKIMGIAQGGPEAYRVSAPEINFMKRQYQNANAQVRNMSAGGQKNRAYRDLALSQPGAISGVFQKKIEAALAQLSSLGQSGFQNTLSANSGVLQGADSMSQLAAARGQAVSGAIGSIAGIAGTALGGGFSSSKSPLVSYANSKPQFAGGYDSK